MEHFTEWYTKVKILQAPQVRCDECRSHVAVVVRARAYVWPWCSGSAYNTLRDVYLKKIKRIKTSGSESQEILLAIPLIDFFKPIGCVLLISIVDFPCCHQVQCMV